jgi:hypothetical protein
MKVATYKLFRWALELVGQCSGVCLCSRPCILQDGHDGSCRCRDHWFGG